MPQDAGRCFSRAFKLKDIERLRAGESGAALSIKRTIMYRWPDAFREGGAEGLRCSREVQRLS